MIWLCVVLVKFVSQLLFDDQKQHCLAVCLSLCSHATEYPKFISNTVTSHESWIYTYMPETKRWTSQRKNLSLPHTKKAWKVSSSIKIMLAFSDHKGLVYHES